VSEPRPKREARWGMVSGCPLTGGAAIPTILERFVDEQSRDADVIGS